jgi:ribosomal protein L29
MDKAGILDAIKSAQKELLNLNFRKAVSGIPKSSELSATRKKIARLQTILKDKQ